MKLSYMVFLALLGCIPRYPLGESVQLVPDECVSAAMGGRILSDVGSGAHLWDGLGGAFTMDQAPEQVSVTCDVALPPDASGHVAVGEWNGRVGISPALWNGVLDEDFNSPYFDVGIASIIAHELGHAMGMVHESDGRAVMFHGTTDALPGPTDAQQLCSLYPGAAACAPSLVAGGLWPDPAP